MKDASHEVESWKFNATQHCRSRLKLSWITSAPTNTFCSEGSPFSGSHLSLSLAAMFSTLPLCIQAASAPFKRSQLGLFHGKCIQFGNNVPFSKHKTRRTWHPNVQSKDLRSEVLGRNMNVKVTTRALKTIKKVYLMPIDWQLPCISWMLTASISFLSPSVWRIGRICP